MSTEKISKQLSQEFPALKSRFATAKVHKRLTDSFYCGTWVVCKGKKSERVIDLKKIILLDGTSFQPAVTKEQFEQVQLIRSNNRN